MKIEGSFTETSSRMFVERLLADSPTGNIPNELKALRNQYLILGIGFLISGLAAYFFLNAHSMEILQRASAVFLAILGGGSVIFFIGAFHVGNVYLSDGIPEKDLIEYFTTFHYECNGSKEYDMFLQAFSDAKNSGSTDLTVTAWIAVCKKMGIYRDGTEISLVRTLLDQERKL